MPRKVPTIPPVAAYPTFLRNGWGKCADATLDRNLFTEVGDRGERRRQREAEAKAVCESCPFRAPCEAWATDTYQTGIWGATTANDRAWTRRRATMAA